MDGALAFHDILKMRHTRDIYLDNSSVIFVAFKWQRKSQFQWIIRCEITRVSRLLETSAFSARQKVHCVGVTNKLLHV